MKSDLETLNPTRVRLTVEVPFDELKPSLDAAYKKIAATVVLPGFRKGKVPARLIDQRFGRAVVLEEAVNEALPKFYTEAVRDKDVQVLGQPEVDVTQFSDGQSLTFTAEVDVRPEIELPDLTGLEVTVDDAEVGAEEVDEQVQSLRERFGVLKGVDRASQDGDFLSIDLSASVDGEPLGDATAKGLSYQIGSGGLLDGLDEAVTGRSAGESTTFTTTLVGGEHTGREAEVAVTVNTVKERELPDLDDDFATTASEFDTLEELRADLRGRLERMKAMQQGVAARDKVLEALLEQIEVPLPATLLATELEWRHRSMQQELDSAGLTKEAYLQSEDRTEEDFDAEVDERARAAIQAQFVLDAVVAKEQIGVNQQELTQHIVRRAQRSGVTPDEFANQVVANNQIQTLVGEVVRGKALALILEGATVRDASGNVIDLSTLREDGTRAPAGETVQVSDTDDTATDEAATDEAATDEAATDEAATDEAATDEAATDEAATDEVATDEVATDEVATDEAATDEAATDEAATEPTTGDAASDAGEPSEDQAPQA